jgi:hypothetical protein
MGDDHESVQLQSIGADCEASFELIFFSLVFDWMVNGETLYV